MFLKDRAMRCVMAFAFAMLAASTLPAAAAAQSVDPQVPPRWLQAVEHCERLVRRQPEEFVDMAGQHPDAGIIDAEWARWLADTQRNRQNCLYAASVGFEGNASVVADRSARIARSDREVAEAFRAARAAAEGDAEHYFGPRLDSPPLGALREALNNARRAQSLTVRARCGAFDYSIPPRTADALNRRGRARDAYLACLADARSEAVRLKGAADGFTVAARALPIYERYACRRRPVPRCLANARLDARAETFSPSNLHSVESARLHYDAVRNESRREYGRLRAWTEVHQRLVAERNAGR